MKVLGRKQAVVMHEGFPWVASFKAPESGEEMWSWCRETYGPAGIAESTRADTTHRWINVIAFGEVHFRNERDLTLFLLRWS